MPKTQFETALQHLQGVVKQYHAKRAELEDICARIPKLQADRETTIRAAKLDNPAAIAAASAIDIKLRMAPHRIRQIEEELADLDGPLYNAALAFRSPLRDQVESLWEAVCTEACEKVKGLGIAMEDGAFDQVVDTVLRGCPIVVEIFELRMLITERPAITFAEGLLAQTPRVERLTALPAGKRLAWTPAKTA